LTVFIASVYHVLRQ